MDNWFTIEQIDRDTFSISEYKHWEETHCYLLCGEKYAILIDTGLGVSNIRKIVDSLTKLPVMTVTTHVHWDHIGGHKYFDNIAVHEAEKDWLHFPCAGCRQLPLCGLAARKHLALQAVPVQQVYSNPITITFFKIIFKPSHCME